MSSAPRLTPTCLIAFTLVATSAQSVAVDIFEATGPTMGTTYSIKWVAESFDPSLQSEIDRRLDDINALMSTYEPTSELSRFNQSRSTDWISISQETALVVHSALEMSNISSGAFDPTVGRLVRLWNFGPNPKFDELPSSDQIKTAMNSVGAHHIAVRLMPPALKKNIPAAELDLSAIAKGYGVDAIAELLRTRNLQDFLVEIGGEVYAAGQKPDGPWKLGIQRPDAPNREFMATVELRDQALATSGDYWNVYEIDGVRYSHTIDPRTGSPVQHPLASASVIADSCMLADAWATTLMVLGSQQGRELADAQQIAAMMIDRDADAVQTVLSKFADAQFHQVDLAEPDVAVPNQFLLTILISVAVFGIAIIGLAVGVILSNKSLKGSCGGLEGNRDEQGRSICEMCTTPPEECDQFRDKMLKQ